MMNKLNQLMQKLARDERGLSTVEYVVLLVLLVVMCVAVWNSFGSMLVEKLEDSGDEFDTQVVTQKADAPGEVADEGEDWDELRQGSN